MSGLQTYTTEIIKKALKTVGSKKLILGSDTTYGNNNIQKIQNRSQKLSLVNKDIDNIMGENIAKLLKL